MILTPPGTKDEKGYVFSSKVEPYGRLQIKKSIFHYSNKKKKNIINMWFGSCEDLREWDNNRR